MFLEKNQFIKTKYCFASDLTNNWVFIQIDQTQILYFIFKAMQICQDNFHFHPENGIKT